MNDTPKNENFKILARSCIGSRPTIHAELVKAYHGLLKPEGERASLIIIDFKFDLTMYPKPPYLAIITVYFGEGMPTEQGCVIRRIAPETFSKQNPGDQTSTASPASTSHAQLSQSQATMTGMIRKGSDYHKSVAKWEITERSKVTSTIPRCMRTAMLLRRADNNFFCVTVKVQLVMHDLEISAGSAGKTITHSPYGFFPEVPTDDLDGIDVQNLGGVDLTKLCFVDRWE